MAKSIANEPVNIMFAALTYDMTNMVAEGMKKMAPPRTASRNIWMK